MLSRSLGPPFGSAALPVARRSDAEATRKKASGVGQMMTTYNCPNIMT
jgi:hypothetical protein